MHRVKSQAKRNAWYNDDSSRAFNPFGRAWRVNSAPIEASTQNQETSSTHTDPQPRPTPGVFVGREEPRPEQSDAIQSDSAPYDAASSVFVPASPKLEGAIVRARVRQRNLGGLLGKLRRKIDDVESVDEKRSTHRVHFTVWSQIQNTIFNSPLNLLLLLSPAGFVVNYTSHNAIASFAVNLVATFPLAVLIAFATDELKMRTGANLGVLIGATFSNAAALVTSIFLLINSQIRVLQITLIGTLLSSMHLMLGISFFFGGLKRVQQHYNANASLIYSKLLLLAMVSVALPTIASQLAGLSDEDVTRTSRGIAFILIVLYAVYLFFQLSTHSAMYDEPSEKAELRNPPKPKREEALKAMTALGGGAGVNAVDERKRNRVPEPDEDDEDEERIPVISTYTIAIVLLVCTTLLAFNTAFATDSLQGLLERSGMTQTFIGIVLLPLIANDFTIITKAVKDEMDDCVSMTVGKCLQLILLVIPIAILLGWILGHDMNLKFDAFEVVALFASVLYVNTMIQSGLSNYLDGALLIGIFLIICLLAYFIH